MVFDLVALLASKVSVAVAVAAADSELANERQGEAAGLHKPDFFALLPRSERSVPEGWSRWRSLQYRLQQIELRCRRQEVE